MPGLVKVNRDLIIEHVKNVVEKYPQVAAAYLFGSALDLCRPDSDIDLGIVIEKGLKPGSREWDLLEARVAAELRPVEGHVFDVVALDPDQPVFVFRVLKEGELIYCRNRDRLTDVLEHVSRRYSDVYPRYKVALQEVLEEVTGGGAGS